METGETPTVSWIWVQGREMRHCKHMKSLPDWIFNNHHLYQRAVMIFPPATSNYNSDCCNEVSTSSNGVSKHINEVPDQDEDVSIPLHPHQNAGCVRWHTFWMNLNTQDGQCQRSVKAPWLWLCIWLSHDDSGLKFILLLHQFTNLMT